MVRGRKEEDDYDGYSMTNGTGEMKGRIIEGRKEGNMSVR